MNRVCKFLVLQFVSFYLLIFLHSTAHAYSSGLIITEVLPNPVGADTQGEYLEIYNNGSANIDITSLKIDGKNISLYSEEESKELNPDQFAIIHDDDFDIKQSHPGNYTRGVLSSTSFSNSGDTLILSNENDEILDNFIYTSSLEGVTITRPELSCSTTAMSFGKTGTFLSLENSNNYDPIIFDFKDCISIQIKTNNEWKTKLEVEDQNEIEIKLDYPSLIFNIQDLIWTLDGTFSSNSNPFVFQSTPDTKHLVDLNVAYNIGNIFRLEKIEILNNKTNEEKIPETIRINEIYPNPSNGGEWLELYNYGDQTIDISGWKIKDASTSSPKPLPDILINPYQFAVLEGDYLSISLNNTGDEITILNNIDEIIDNISYSETKKDFSINYTDLGLELSITATKGQVNIITPDTSDQENTENEEVQTQLISLPIKEVKVKKLETIIKTFGTLTVDSGVLGANIFYIQDKTGGIKVKTKKGILEESLPEKTEIEIIGELKQSVGELYIYIDKEENLKTINKNKEYYITKLELIKNLENYEGQLIEIQGVLTSSQSSSFVLEIEGEQLKTSILSTSEIEIPEKTKGDLVKVIGILSQYKTSTTTGEGFRLLPRKTEDIEIFNQELKNDFDVIVSDPVQEIVQKTNSPDEVYMNTSVSPAFLNTTQTDNPPYQIAKKYYKNPPRISIDPDSNKKSSNSNTLEPVKYSGLFVMSMLGLWETPGAKEIMLALIKRINPGNK